MKFIVIIERNAVVLQHATLTVEASDQERAVEAVLKMADPPWMTTNVIESDPVTVSYVLKTK